MIIIEISIEDLHLSDDERMLDADLGKDEVEGEYVEITSLDSLDDLSQFGAYQLL